MKLSIFLLVLVWFAFLSFVPMHLFASELSVSTGISYSADTPHHYDMLGDEMGFHLLVNQNGAVTHYLLDNDGQPITSPNNFTKTFETSGAKAASIAKAGDKLAVVYEKNGDLKIWINNDGGLANSWEVKTPYDNSGSGLQRISSKGYEDNIHITWDTGSTASTKEIHYARFDLDDNAWYDYKNVSDVSGEADHGQWPDVEVTDYNGTVRVHVTWQNPKWTSFGTQPKSSTNDTQKIIGAFNRDREFPGSWKPNAEEVWEKENDFILEAGFTSPFICSFSNQSKIFSVFTYADKTARDPWHYYANNRYRNVALYGDEWSVLHGDSQTMFNDFFKSHYAFCDSYNNPEILYWALKYPTDGKIHLRVYQNNVFNDIKTIDSGEFPKMSANTLCSRYVTWKKNNQIWVYRKYRGSISGAITENTMWSGDITVSGDVIVNSGVTLTVLPGTTVTFSDGDDQSGGEHSSKSEIIVNGTLKADDAAFTAASKGDWYGVVFKSSASSSSYLDGCVVEKAWRGVSIDNCDLSLESIEKTSII